MMGIVSLNQGLRPVVVGMLAMLAVPAFADDGTQPDPNGSDQSPASPAPKPDAPTPQVPNPAKDVQTYAGVGSDVAYGDRGVGEFGGSLGLSASNDVLNVTADPTVGYFAWDNIEFSAILGGRHLTIENTHANQLSLLVEPSVHLPINDGLFWFGGLGLGAALVDTSQNDLVAGFDMAPRTGFQILLGRSGLLDLGARYNMVFSSADVQVTPAGGETLLAFVNTFDLQAGYTVMF
jgi:hypothetical protein